jgi:hypothetical protein
MRGLNRYGPRVTGNVGVLILFPSSLPSYRFRVMYTTTWDAPVLYIGPKGMSYAEVRQMLKGG